MRQRYIEKIRLLNERVKDSPLKNMSFKAIVIMPNVFLQNPSRTSKSKKQELSLGQRLDLWKNGELEEPVFEGETIQKLLKVYRNHQQLLKYQENSNSMSQ